MIERLTLKHWGLLLLLATTVLFAVSTDSYTHDLWCHGDSAWFFLCGESWMRGLIPYDDFTDSKGPLLWLIYGVGYLFSHHDYIGVFWISCVMYAVIYTCIYRLSLIYLHSKRWAMVITVAMTLMLFFPWVHYETRCEDFNMMFVAIALTETTSLLVAEGTHLRRTSLVVGACAAATLLIKYNITPFFAVLGLFIMVEAWRRGASAVRALALMFGGAAAVTMPFVVCMFIQGNLDDFVREYFANTFTVVGDSQASLGGSLRHLLRYWRSLLPVIGVSLLGGVLMPMVHGRYRWLPLCVVLTVVLLSMIHATWTFHYGMCLVLPVYALIALCQRLHGRGAAHAAVATPLFRWSWVIVIVLATVAVNWFRNGEALFFKHHPRSADMVWYSQLMGQVNHPTVMYYFTGPSPEHGIQVDALPACRYWASQSGATKLMDEQQRSVAREGGADFVFALQGTAACDKLKAMGYTHYPSSPASAGELKLDMFTRHHLAPVERRQPSATDILLKRNLSH